jgi:hypothetical protein
MSSVPSTVDPLARNVEELRALPPPAQPPAEDRLVVLSDPLLNGGDTGSSRDTVLQPFLKAATRPSSPDRLVVLSDPLLNGGSSRDTVLQPFLKAATRPSSPAPSTVPPPIASTSKCESVMADPHSPSASAPSSPSIGATAKLSIVQGPHDGVGKQAGEEVMAERSAIADLPPQQEAKDPEHPPQQQQQYSSEQYELQRNVPEERSDSAQQSPWRIAMEATTTPKTISSSSTSTSSRSQQPPLTMASASLIQPSAAYSPHSSATLPGHSWSGDGGGDDGEDDAPYGHLHSVGLAEDGDDDDDDDEDDEAVISNIDGYLAQEAERKLVAPIQSINLIVQMTTHHCTAHTGSSNNGAGMPHPYHQYKLHHHLDDADDDDEDMSVLTMDPALQAISKREADGLIMFPTTTTTKPEKQRHFPVLEDEKEDNIYDMDDYDADDLSEIAPLDLHSL